MKKCYVPFETWVVGGEVNGDKMPVIVKYKCVTKRLSIILPKLVVFILQVMLYVLYIVEK